ncbi:MAG TPA: hypothetical protein ENJ77_01405 [Candidatus Moranbacteria bacterium]|nr:hypothetical protein [Candidatus Moranbacteria bacterium]
MFGLRKNKKEKKASVKKKETEVSYEVITMADDLKRLEEEKNSARSISSQTKKSSRERDLSSGPFGTQSSLKQEKIPAKQEKKPAVGSSKPFERSNSPFLATPAENVAAATSPAVVASGSASAGKKTEAEISGRKRHWLIWPLALAVFAAAAVGGYFFFASLLPASPSERNDLPVEVSSETNRNVSEGPEVESKKDVLVLQLGKDLNVRGMSVRLQELAKKINLSGKEFTEPIGVIDEKGEPIPFAEFAARFLPLLSPEVADTVPTPFSIYILPEGDDYRVGLALISADPDKTRAALRKEEANLPNALRPLMLFKPEGEQPLEYKFEDNSHRSIPIRFYNFKPDASQSVDYTVHYDNVFIGTSKKTMRKMMDLVFAEQDARREAEESQRVEEVSSQTSSTGATSSDADLPEESGENSSIGEPVGPVRDEASQSVSADSTGLEVPGESTGSADQTDQMP